MRLECCTRVARGRFCNKSLGQCCRIFIELNFYNMLQILGIPGYTCNRLRFLSQNSFEGDELPVQLKNRMCSRGFRHEMGTFQPNTFQDMFFGHLETRGEESVLQCELSSHSFLRQYIISMEKSYSTANVLRVYKLLNHTCSFRDAYQFKLLSSVSYEAYRYL